MNTVTEVSEVAFSIRETSYVFRSVQTGLARGSRSWVMDSDGGGKRTLRVSVDLARELVGWVWTRRKVGTTRLL